MDSYYEYMYKSYVLFGHVGYLHMFEQSYAAVEKYISLKKHTEILY